MSLIVVEYYCDEHGRHDAIVERSDVKDVDRCPECGRAAYFVMSAASVKLPRFEVVRGSVAEPPSPYAQDTRPIAEGQSIADWKANRKKLRRERRRAQIKKMLG